MSAKLKRVQRMLYGLGFHEAPRWDEDKVRKVALGAVTRFKEEQVDERYRKTFRIVRKYARSGNFLELTSDLELKQPRKRKRKEDDDVSFDEGI